MKETVAVLCDMHLCSDRRSPQYAFLLMAVERMKRDGIQTVLTLGDVTAFGDPAAWALYLETIDPFDHYEIIGNADVRDAKTAKALEAATQNRDAVLEGRRAVGLNTPSGEIFEQDWARLESLSDGGIVWLHYYLDALKEPTKTRFLRLLKERKLTVLHGHAHMDFDYRVGKTHVLGFRGLDPDKAIGGYPCIHYLTLGETVTAREIAFPIDSGIVRDIRNRFGVSCVDLQNDVRYALERGIRSIELRCDKKSWSEDPSLAELIEKWRAKTNGFLSVHMPNLSWKDGTVIGGEKWNAVLDYAQRLGADHLTVHPPRRTARRDVMENPDCFAAFLRYYTEAVRKLPDRVTVGIENLHCEPDEKCDENRCFAYCPEEVSLWIDAINESLGMPNRVGHVLDTGHARNNGSFAKKYPLSRWYLEMGGRAKAYHIHQSVKQENGQLKNHRPIESWFGPMINYCGFLWAWDQGLLNHAPIFLEVKGWENHEKSMKGFAHDFSLE